MRARLLLPFLLSIPCACKQDAPAPATEPSAAAQGDEPKTSDEPKTDGDIEPGDEPKPTKVGGDPETNGDSKGGLAGVTAKVIDDARRASRDPSRLVPDAADFVVMLRPPALLGYAPAAELWKLAEKDTELRNASETIRGCLGSLEVIDEVVIGFDSDEHVLLVARGKGLGTDDAWNCFRQRTLDRGSTWDTTLTGTAPGKGPQLVSDDGDQGYFLDDSTLVMVSKEWDADVQRLMGGTGTSAADGRLARPLSRIDRSEMMWLAGAVGPKLESSLTGGPFVGMQDVAVTLRREGDGVQLWSAIDAGDEADATRMRDELQKQFDQMKAMLPMLGVPGTVADRIVFASESDLVTITMSMTQAELEATRVGIEKNF